MKKINYIDSIKTPIITEKATVLSEQNKTVFKVHKTANKKTIKKNIEKLFKVNVIKVNIVNKNFACVKECCFVVLSAEDHSGVRLKFFGGKVEILNVQMDDADA